MPPPGPNSPTRATAALDRLDAAVAADAGRLAADAREPVERWRAEAAALRYHLDPTEPPGVTVVVGGTGTGKSTLVNRLVGATVTAASFRRTFTTGAVAVVTAGRDLPAGWMGVSHVPADPAGPPPRGQTGAVVVVEQPPGPGAQSSIPVLVDTPDLDGDQPANHAQADRAFRWADRVVFVVTPEKYQMTELLPYYRLGRRWGVPAAFVMNKCEEPAVLADYRRQLSDRDWPDAAVFAVARDDAGYQPPAGVDLAGLRAAVAGPVPPASPVGRANRVADVVARLTDQVIAPQRESRRTADRLCAALRAMETPAAGVDVNPLTQQLQRRLQQRSVLYLLGPQRVLDRVRQVPTLLARLPRATWDWVMRGHAPVDLIDPQVQGNPNDPPDFAAALVDQFTVLRSRIDDVLRTDPAAAKWMDRDAAAYAQALLDPAAAGAVADEEVGALRQWLEGRWNATPRDTRMLQSLLKHLPGGKRLSKLSEAAPYLLTIAVVTHHVMFGHVDLIVLGGYGLATWLTERVSNEVTAHTRATNRKIADRFEQLAHEQIRRACAWLDRHAPPAVAIEELDAVAGELAEAGAEMARAE